MENLTTTGIFTLNTLDMSTTENMKLANDCINVPYHMRINYVDCNIDAKDVKFCTTLDTFEVVKSALMALLCIIAISANITTIIATFHVKPPRKAHHYLFRNLFVVDILASVALLVNASRSLVGSLDFDVLPVQNTKLNYTITYAPLCAAFSCSVFALLGLAIQRYIAVFYPLHHSSVCTKRNATIYITCSWIVAIILGVLVLLWSACVLPVKDFLLPIIPAIGLFLILIIIAMCFRVYAKTRQAMSNIRNLERKTSSNNPKGIKESHNAIITTLLLTLTLIISIIPFLVTSIFVLSKFNVPRWLNALTDGLLFLNYISDPIIYPLRTRDMHDGYKAMKTRCGNTCCRRQSENTSKYSTSKIRTVSMTTTTSDIASDMSQISSL